MTGLPQSGQRWVNRHTDRATEITGLATDRRGYPGGERDVFVVHHTSNVPPGFKRGHGDELESFLKHWERAT